MVIFFIAGHDTTANALAGIAYELAVNPVSQNEYNYPYN